jgi:hypothetical protein
MLESVPVKFSSPFGGTSPATWALMVRAPRLADDVLSPMSSVARTVNEYWPAQRLNGVV